MTIYRLHVYSEERGSEGYEFFGALHAAESRRSALIREGYARDGLILDSAPAPESKEAMIRLLRRWASHNDNG